MTSREKFEQAIKARFGDSIDYRVCKNSDGEYMAWDMQVAWWAWQAAETDMAVQLANAESKCRELAAECAALKDGVNKAVEDIQCFYDSYGWHVSEDGESETAVVALDDAKGSIEHFALSVKTPVTDAFMAEVRAQGVEACAESLLSNDDIGVDSEYPLMRDFAAQLRKGAAL
ncbi:hypothetical protein OGY83_06515 [Citrobacter sp. Cpo090]|uniref:hypothetical protein n=1 Tax=Citrobacter sp. Cpo090 TaxID=2985139 RepID=UPI002575E524|nr:hypothetical protein [Citrobacter sp. Cpo090]MDM2843283.1 hypothetical protein [Citrobacter sp. Cpo090]